MIYRGGFKVEYKAFVKSCLLHFCKQLPLLQIPQHVHSINSPVLHFTTADSAATISYFGKKPCFSQHKKHQKHQQHNLICSPLHMKPLQGTGM
jgi:translation elongation factor EF-1alpha